MKLDPSTADSSLADAEHETKRVSFVDALKVSVITSVLFLVVYPAVAIITAMRAEADPSSIGTWYYQWEQMIPFVAIMIVPYMSIDLFFALSPFLCGNKTELRVLAKRLTAVVVIAAICFLVYPLRLAVERPEATGFFGAIYNWFTSMDKPYNLCPSMHIALRTVLAAHYAKHCRGIIRWLMNVWFFLIGLSTLLLYQHHVIDVVGGFILGVAVMYAIDGMPWRSPKLGGGRFALMYAAMSGLFILPIAWFPKIGWWTWWPGIACGLVALGYAWAGPAVYRRRNGKLSWATRVLLGPVLVAQWLSWKYYANQSSAIDHVADGVWIGRHLTEAEAKNAIGDSAASDSIGAVIDVCNAFDEPDSLQSIQRLELPVLDLTAPTKAQIDQAIEFIETHRQVGVLVHCKAGYSRSAAIVAAWLVRTGRSGSPAEAFELLRTARPNIVVRPEIQSLEFV